MDAPLNQRRQQPRRLCALCTYNERETLPALVDAVLATVPDTHLLVVDDNSPDGTEAWFHEIAQHEPRVSCLRRSAKLGLGTAVIAAIGHAIDHGFTYLATLDADGSHDPAALPQLFAVAENVDVVIGSRYCSGGHIEGWPWWRRIVSRGVNVASRRFLRLPLNDCSGNFRVY